MSFTILDDDEQPQWAFCRICGVDRDTSAFADAGVCPYCHTALEDQASRTEVEAALAELAAPPPPRQTPLKTDALETTEAYVPPEPQLDPDITRELATRALCRRKFIPFVKRFRPKYDAGWVHEDICRRLEKFVADVEAGLSPRLLLLLPPRTGKSELGSRHFPAWALGKHPDWEIIATSHTSSLTMSFSRYVRDLLRDPAYTAIFPTTKLDPSSQSIENWNIQAGGGYLAAGIGSGITGRGAHILILDDVVKDLEAANSQTIRDNTWEWYISTAYTRLAPGGGVLGILTWWHDDDWAGRIMQTMAADDGDQFEIVKYPAINDRGDEYRLLDGTIQQFTPEELPPEGSTLTRIHNTAIHPARYTTAMMLRIKNNMYAAGQQRTWNSLYQQNPAPEDGLYFTKDMFRYYSTLPPRDRCHVYQAWDFAITEGTASDYTVGVTLYQDENDAVYVADVVRFKSGDSFFIVDQILDYARQWDATLLGFEDGQIWKAMQSLYDKRSQERKQYQSYEILKPLTDKMVRASPLRGRMQQGKVYFDEKAPWFRDLYHELTRFPAGKHDDCFSEDTMVDCPSGPVKIGLLEDGDEVLTYDGADVIVGAVSDYHCTGVKLLLELELDDGTTIKITPGHPVLTSTGYVYAGDLTSSSQIVRKDICRFRNSVSSGRRKREGITSPQPRSTVNVCGSTSTPTPAHTASHLPGRTSITKMATKTTTSWITYSASRLKNTLPSTRKTGVQEGEHRSICSTSNVPVKVLSQLKKALTSALVRAEKVSSVTACALSVKKSSLSNSVTKTLQCTAQPTVTVGRERCTPWKTTQHLYHARTALQNLLRGVTASAISCFVPRVAETSIGTLPATYRGNANGAVWSCASQKETPQVTVPRALPPELKNYVSARVVGERFYPTNRMRAYTAIGSVLTTPEDLSVTLRAMNDTSKLFVKVVSVREIGYQPTYNFEVAGTRNFLVDNGVVVHNCVDALSWCIRLTLSQTAPRSVDRHDKLPSWKDKLKAGGGVGATFMAA